MNHDYEHCLDFQADCPFDCFRAKLVRDLEANDREKLVSWMSMIGTPECKRGEKKRISLAKMKVSLDEGAIIPTRAYAADAGLDIRTPERRVIHGRCREVIDTGVHVEIPPGYVGFLKSKSGLMCKHGITSEGTIDSGYTGSIRVCLFNHSDVPYIVNKGDKVSQLVILPILTPEVEEVEEIQGIGERGSGGFGSTGK